MCSCFKSSFRDIYITNTTNDSNNSFQKRGRKPLSGVVKAQRLVAKEKAKETMDVKTNSDPFKNEKNQRKTIFSIF